MVMKFIESSSTVLLTKLVYLSPHLSLTMGSRNFWMPPTLKIETSVLYFFYISCVAALTLVKVFKMKTVFFF